MNTRIKIYALLLFLMTTPFCKADVFISFTGMNDGNANTTNNATFEVGDTGTAYIWFSDDTKVDTGAFLDFVSSDLSVVRFTEATVFNSDILSGGTTVNTRWQSTSSGTVSDGLVDEMAGVRLLSGTGILPSQVTGSALEDALHDGTSNAFLFGSVNFEAVSLGDTVLSASVGDGLIVDEGVALTPNFRSASISVTAVPEPSSAALLLGFVAVTIARRNRKQVSIAL